MEAGKEENLKENAKRDPLIEKIALVKKKQALEANRSERLKEALKITLSKIKKESLKAMAEVRDWVVKGWKRLVPHLKSVGKAVKTRRFLVFAIIFFSQIAGFVTGQRFSRGFVVLIGAASGILVYTLYSNLQKDRDEIRNERDRIKVLEDRSRILLDNALDCVFTLDLQGNITSFNRRSEQATGYSKRDVLGNSLGMFLPPEGLKDFFDKLHKAIRTGVVPKYELDINTIYGRRNFEMNLTAIKNHKKTVGVQGIARDITEKKRLQKELKISMSNLERWSKRTVKKEMTILEMKNQLKTIKKELESHGGQNN